MQIAGKVVLYSSFIITLVRSCCVIFKNAVGRISGPSSGVSTPISAQYSKKDKVGTWITLHRPAPLSVLPFISAGLADPVATICVDGCKS